MLLNTLPGATLGKPRWLVRFFCRPHGEGLPWSLLCSNLFQYKILTHSEHGVYAVEKLTELEQNRRAILREKHGAGRLR